MINQSTVFVTVFLVIASFTIPRKYFLVPYVLAACFLPADQRIVITDLDFTPLRILVVAGFLRIFLIERNYAIKWNNFDKLVVAWAICGAIIYCIQWLDTRAFIYKSGILFDIFGLYWLFRKTINSWASLRLILKIFAICSLLLAVLVGWEWATGQNPFTAMGRVQTVVRQGHYRCQASFPHSIMLGLFWSTLVPLFAGLAMTEKKKVLYWIAVVASIFIVVATASSTPIIVLSIVLIGLCGYKWRQYTGCIAWGFLASLIALHIVMKPPIWHLIGRVSIISGSASWHRYNLIDKAIKNFGEWVLLGSRSTGHWGWELQDVTNQFVLEGVRGGLITLVIFLVMLYHAFKIILNNSLRANRDDQRILTWCFFAAMLGHCVGFWGVSYFGQITMLWYMNLAIVSFLAEYQSYCAIILSKTVSVNPAPG